MKILGREPAVFFALIAAAIQLLSVTVTHWDPETQGVINAVVVALAGFFTALSLATEKAFAALAGLIKAVFALMLAFGLHVDAPTQTAVMVLVTAVGAFIVRQNADAPVTKEGAVSCR